MATIELNNSVYTQIADADERFFCTNPNPADNIDVVFAVAQPDPATLGHSLLHTLGIDCRVYVCSMPCWAISTGGASIKMIIDRGWA